MNNKRTLIPAHVPPGKVFEWLLTGWQLFMRAPGVWLVQMLLFLAINFMIGLTVVLAPLATPVLFPVFCAGMIYSASRLARGERIEVTDVFAGFRKNTGNLLVLGGGYLMGFGLVMLLSVLIGGGAAMMSLVLSKLGGFAWFGGLWLGTLIFSLLWITLIMALWFAPALVMLAGVAPLDSLLLSARACARNLPTAVLMGVSLYLLVWLAMLPAALGILVLMPVISGAVFASFRDVFGASIDAPAANEFSAALNAPEGPQDAR